MIRRIVFAVADAYVAYSKYGGGFKSTLERFSKVQALSEGDFAQWRRARLAEILSRAARAPKYQGIADRCELSAFPLLDKHEYRVEAAELRVADSRLRARYVRTSGSTGAPLQITTHTKHLNAMAASWWAFRRRFGVHYGERGVVFGGRKLFPSNSSVSSPWLRGIVSGQTLVSTYHLDARNLERIARFISSSDISWIHGYPSALLPVAKIFCELGLKTRSPLKLVSTGSETLDPSGRDMLARAFGAPVSEFYGQGEGVASLWRCSEGRLHDQGLVGHIELLPTEYEGLSEIVGTGYWNFLAPMVRYRTGDLLWVDKSPCLCGNAFPLGRDVEGRSDDFVVTRSGRRVGRLAKLFTVLSGVSRTQLAQTGFGRFELRFLSNEPIKGKEKFEKELSGLLGENVEVAFIPVGYLPRGANGKSRAVVREVKLVAGWGGEVD